MKIIFLSVALLLFTACSPQREHEGMIFFNGAIFGSKEDQKPKLTIGLGDTKKDIANRNNFLSKTSILNEKPLRINLMKHTISKYKDANFEINIDCTETALIDDIHNHGWINSITLISCTDEASENNWTKAIKDASALIDQVTRQNKNLNSIDSLPYREKPSEEILKMDNRLAIRTPRVFLKPSEVSEWLYSIKNLTADEAYEQGLPQGVTVGYFYNEKIIINISIQRYQYFGGINLSRNEKLKFSYQTAIHFKIRDDYINHKN